jgi:hypothetical protein
MPNGNVYLLLFSATSRSWTHFLTSIEALIALNYGDLFACPSFSPAFTFAHRFIVEV